VTAQNGLKERGQGGFGVSQKDTLAAGHGQASVTRPGWAAQSGVVNAGWGGVAHGCADRRCRGARRNDLVERCPALARTRGWFFALITEPAVVWLTAVRFIMRIIAYLVLIFGMPAMSVAADQCESLSGQGSGCLATAIPLVNLVVFTALILFAAFRRKWVHILGGIIGTAVLYLARGIVFVLLNPETASKAFNRKPNQPRQGTLASSRHCCATLG
jgi:hypothetical protein